MSVTPVHFMDLRDHAVRGPHIERGLPYVLVKSHLGQASEAIAASSIYDIVWVHDETTLPAFDALYPLYDGRLWMTSEYCSDTGMWDVPGCGYRNTTNYLLDPLALLRQGIRVVVDDSRRVPYKSEHDDWDDWFWFNSSYFDK